MKELPRLPAERTVKVLAGRWKLPILWHVIQGPRRLVELERLVAGVTQKVLIQQLRELEAHGLVKRAVFAEVPARVEYSATPLGASLLPLMGSLCEWGHAHARAFGEDGQLPVLSTSCATGK
jgi:DNA-binding HxlR family transcriptional regulator